jgi:hypothetical protein
MDGGVLLSRSVARELPQRASSGASGFPPGAAVRQIA